ncbi:MAG: hypothetical protein EZS28_002640 [Streblomastix strix]|uniref:Uncharacterized protein n=1 Tax=Streblomastix strix TaxID=222440 RepID=A0A5J4X4W0_9EUKA|nr:MAG: hypothetical protein EZS28_002640 [Streblomastix strix]
MSNIQLIDRFALITKDGSDQLFVEPDEFVRFWKTLLDSQEATKFLQIFLLRACDSQDQKVNEKIQKIISGKGIMPPLKVDDPQFSSIFNSLFYVSLFHEFMIFDSQLSVARKLWNTISESQWHLFSEQKSTLEIFNLAINKYEKPWKDVYKRLVRYLIELQHKQINAIPTSLTYPSGVGLNNNMYLIARLFIDDCINFFAFGGDPIQSSIQSSSLTSPSITNPSQQQQQQQTIGILEKRGKWTDNDFYTTTPLFDSPYYAYKKLIKRNELESSLNELKKKLQQQSGIYNYGDDMCIRDSELDRPDHRVGDIKRVTLNEYKKVDQLRDQNQQQLNQTSSQPSSSSLSKSSSSKQINSILTNNQLNLIDVQPPKLDLEEEGFQALQQWSAGGPHIQHEHYERLQQKQQQEQEILLRQRIDARQTSSGRGADKSKLNESSFAPNKIGSSFSLPIVSLKAKQEAASEALVLANDFFLMRASHEQRTVLCLWINDIISKCPCQDIHLLSQLRDNLNGALAWPQPTGYVAVRTLELINREICIPGSGVISRRSKQYSIGTLFTGVPLFASESFTKHPLGALVLCARYPRQPSPDVLIASAIVDVIQHTIPSLQQQIARAWEQIKSENDLKGAAGIALCLSNRQLLQLYIEISDILAGPPKYQPQLKVSIEQVGGNSNAFNVSITTQQQTNSQSSHQTSSNTNIIGNRNPSALENYVHIRDLLQQAKIWVNKIYEQGYDNYWNYKVAQKMKQTKEEEKKERLKKIEDEKLKQQILKEKEEEERKYLKSFKKYDQSQQQSSTKQLNVNPITDVQDEEEDNIIYDEALKTELPRKYHPPDNIRSDITSFLIEDNDFYRMYVTVANQLEENNTQMKLKYEDNEEYSTDMKNVLKDWIKPEDKGNKENRNQNKVNEGQQQLQNELKQKMNNISQSTSLNSNSSSSDSDSNEQEQEQNESESDSEQEQDNQSEINNIESLQLPLLIKCDKSALIEGLWEESGQCGMIINQDEQQVSEDDLFSGIGTLTVGSGVALGIKKNSGFGLIKSKPNFLYKRIENKLSNYLGAIDTLYHHYVELPWSSSTPFASPSMKIRPPIIMIPKRKRVMKKKSLIRIQKQIEQMEYEQQEKEKERRIKERILEIKEKKDRERDDQIGLNEQKSAVSGGMKQGFQNKAKLRGNPPPGIVPPPPRIDNAYNIQNKKIEDFDRKDIQDFSNKLAKDMENEKQDQNTINIEEEKKQVKKIFQFITDIDDEDDEEERYQHLLQAYNFQSDDDDDKPSLLKQDLLLQEQQYEGGELITAKPKKKKKKKKKIVGQKVMKKVMIKKKKKKVKIGSNLQQSGNNKQVDNKKKAYKNKKDKRKKKKKYRMDDSDESDSDSDESYSLSSDDEDDDDDSSDTSESDISDSSNTSDDEYGFSDDDFFYKKKHNRRIRNGDDSDDSIGDIKSDSSSSSFDDDSDDQKRNKKRKNKKNKKGKKKKNKEIKRNQSLNIKQDDESDWESYYEEVMQEQEIDDQLINNNKQDSNIDNKDDEYEYEELDEYEDDDQLINNEEGEGDNNNDDGIGNANEQQNKDSNIYSNDYQDINVAQYGLFGPRNPEYSGYVYQGDDDDDEEDIQDISDIKDIKDIELSYQQHNKDMDTIGEENEDDYDQKEKEQEQKNQNTDEQEDEQGNSGSSDDEDDDDDEDMNEQLDDDYHYVYDFNDDSYYSKQILESKQITVQTNKQKLAFGIFSSYSNSTSIYGVDGTVKLSDQRKQEEQQDKIDIGGSLRRLINKESKDNKNKQDKGKKETLKVSPKITSPQVNSSPMVLHDDYSDNQHFIDTLQSDGVDAEQDDLSNINLFSKKQNKELGCSIQKLPLTETFPRIKPRFLTQEEILQRRINRRSNKYQRGPSVNQSKISENEQKLKQPGSNIPSQYKDKYSLLTLKKKKKKKKKKKQTQINPQFDPAVRIENFFDNLQIGNGWLTHSVIPLTSPYHMSDRAIQLYLNEAHYSYPFALWLVEYWVRDDDTDIIQQQQQQQQQQVGQMKQPPIRQRLGSLPSADAESKQAAESFNQSNQQGMDLSVYKPPNSLSAFTSKTVGVPSFINSPSLPSSNQSNQSNQYTSLSQQQCQCFPFIGLRSKLSNSLRWQQLLKSQKEKLSNVQKQIAQLSEPEQEYQPTPLKDMKSSEQTSSLSKMHLAQTIQRESGIQLIGIGLNKQEQGNSGSGISVQFKLAQLQIQQKVLLKRQWQLQQMQQQQQQMKLHSQIIIHNNRSHSSAAPPQQQFRPRSQTMAPIQLKSTIGMSSSLSNNGQGNSTQQKIDINTQQNITSQQGQIKPLYLTMQHPSYRRVFCTSAQLVNNTNDISYSYPSINTQNTQRTQSTTQQSNQLNNNQSTLERGKIKDFEQGNFKTKNLYIKYETMTADGAKKATHSQVLQVNAAFMTATSIPHSSDWGFANNAQMNVSCETLQVSIARSLRCIEAGRVVSRTVSEMIVEAVDRVDDFFFWLDGQRYGPCRMLRMLKYVPLCPTDSGTFNVAAFMPKKVAN